MEALNAAAALTPISVLSDRKLAEPKKHLALPIHSTSPLKISHSSNSSKTPQVFSSRSFHGGFVLLSSVLNTGLAKALTYEEALQQSVTSSDSSSSDIDIGGILDSAISFGVENPAVIIGAATVVVVPLVLSQLLGGKAKAFGVESAKSAYAKLGEDESAQLIDIRAPVDIKQVGSPDVRGLKKKAISVVYKGEDKPGFLKKLSLKFKEPENTTLFILDKFDGSSELVAELVTANGFRAAYAVKDGAEGSRGWMSSGLPWIQPKKSFSFDLSGFTDAIDGAFGEGSEAISLVFGIAAAAGLSLLAFTEVETILEFLGSAAIIQLVSKKLLFAEDRKLTLKQVEEFVNTKIGPKEFVDEIVQIGKALLPTPVISKSLPAPTEVSPAEASAVETVTETEASAAEIVTESNSAPAKEVAAEPPPQVNSALKTEVKADTIPKLSQSLSPYPNFPDFRPPTSPTPSKP